MTRLKWDSKEEEDIGDLNLNDEYIDVDIDGLFHKRKRIRGIRRATTNENARIIGGGEATRNRYPYIASITYERGTFDHHFLLISKAHVVYCKYNG